MPGADANSDRNAFKESQRQNWNEDAAGWNRWSFITEQTLHETTLMMLNLAQLASGSRVLDIATGAGEPALSAAAALGEDGYVLATDLSERLVEITRHNAQALGLNNVECRVMDGEHLTLPDESFDVVMCRAGLMYMPDPELALAEWRRVLKPGGRAIVAVPIIPRRDDPERRPALSSLIKERADLPSPPSSSGTLNLQDETVLTKLLSDAGFESVEMRTAPIFVLLESADQYVHYARESFGAFNQLMSHLPNEEREEIWDDVLVALRPFESEEGFEIRGESLVACSIK